MRRKDREVTDIQEISAKEYRTSQRIAEILREIGYENVRVGLPGAPEIGVTADLKCPD